MSFYVFSKIVFENSFQKPEPTKMVFVFLLNAE